MAFGTMLARLALCLKAPCNLACRRVVSCLLRTVSIIRYSIAGIRTWFMRYLAISCVILLFLMSLDPSLVRCLILSFCIFFPLASFTHTPNSLIALGFNYVVYKEGFPLRVLSLLPV